MALRFFDPNPNPFQPVRTTNSKDVFDPNPTWPTTWPDEPGEPDPLETDEPAEQEKAE